MPREAGSLGELSGGQRKGARVRERASRADMFSSRAENHFGTWTFRMSQHDVLHQPLRLESYPHPSAFPFSLRHHHGRHFHMRLRWTPSVARVACLAEAGWNEDRAEGQDRSVISD